jgi:hypothetical protein
MERKHEKYEQLIARCQGLTPVPTAVAHPCDESSLRGAVEAAELGILQPILVGPKARIEAVAAQCQLDLSSYEIVDAPHSHAAAELAVQRVREGQAELLMKGSLHTDELMGALVSRLARWPRWSPGPGGKAPARRWPHEQRDSGGQCRLPLVARASARRTAGFRPGSFRPMKNG